MSQVEADARALMDEFTLADFLGVAVQTVRKWRWQRSGPSFVKTGRLVRYRLADVEAWLDRQTVPSREVA